MTDQARNEHVEARRVLLDALEALRDAVVLVGAQATYLRTTDRFPAYQPFTNDADIVLDPSLLADHPALGDVMRNAGFVLTAKPRHLGARDPTPIIHFGVQRASLAVKDGLSLWLRVERVSHSSLTLRPDS